MNKKQFFSAFAVVAVLSGCVTQTIKQGKDVSSSGVAYTEAVGPFLQVALDNAYQYDTDVLKKSRVSSDPAGNLDRANSDITEFRKQVDRFRASNSALNAYFMSLQALANEPVKENNSAAVAALSKNVSELSAKDNISLSADKQTQVGKLSGLVAQSVQAGMLRDALTRDAPVIGKALALQEDGIKIVADKLKSNLKDESEAIYQEQVKAPYVSGKKTLPETWGTKRIQYLEYRFANDKLASVEVAAKKMRDVWEQVVAGKADPDNLKSLVSDIDEFVKVVGELSKKQPK